MGLALLAVADAAAATNGWHGPHFFLFGPLIGLLWIAGAILLFRLLLHRGWGHDAASRRSADPRDRARSILAERYARGEISTEEYWERRDQLA